MAVVGIDLGTTNTVVAAVRDGRAAALKDKLGHALLPSVVQFPETGNPIIGRAAREARPTDPRNTVFSIKRLIGRAWDSEQVQKARGRFPFELKEGPGKATLIQCRGTSYTLPEISAMVLESAREIAEHRIGSQVSDVVITVPASFNDLQRAATKVAARVAGLEVLRILNEPTAAALAYGFGRQGRERIAVYDFGGGTFDITLLDLSENVFEVIATAGDSFLGGDDVDNAIVERMAEQLKKDRGVDAEQHLSVRESLRLAAESLKCDLSTRSQAKAYLQDVGAGKLGRAVEFEFTMKRSEFEQLCEPLVNRTLDVCRESLEIAGITVKDLDQVLLVGGSTRIPLVRRRISSFFGKMPQSRINPDEVVAIGAAIQAAALDTGTSLAPLGSQAPAARTTTSAPKAGLLGLRKTLPERTSSPPVQEGSEPPKKREQSILSALPKARSEPPAAPTQVRPGSTVLGVGDAKPTVKMTANAPLPPPRGLMKTIAGVGDEARFAPTQGGPSRAADPFAGFESPGGAPAGDGSVTFDLDTLEAEADLPSVSLRSVDVDLPSALPKKSRPPAALEAELPIVAPKLGEPALPARKLEVAPVGRAGATNPVPSSPPPAARKDFPKTTTLKPDVPKPLDADLPDLPNPNANLPQRAGRSVPPPMVDLPSPQGTSLPSVAAQLPIVAAQLPQVGVGGQLPSVAGQLPGLVDQLPSAASGGQAGPVRLPPPANPAFASTQLGDPALPPPQAANPALASTQLGLGGPPQPVPNRPLPPAAAASPLPPAPGARSGRTSLDLFDDAPDSDEGARLSGPGSLPPPLPVNAVAVGGLGSPGARRPLLLDVTPLSLGVEVVGGYTQRIIERNSPIPCEQTSTFGTARDQQTQVRVRVCQGETTTFEQNTVLGEVILSGLQPAPRGTTKVEVTFSLDENGMLQVSARDRGTGAAAQAVLRLVGQAEAAH